MREVTLNLPDELEEIVQLPPPAIADEIRLMAALKMFELGRLSSSQAAALAGLSRVEFLDACGRFSVSPFNYSPEELDSSSAIMPERS